MKKIGWGAIVLLQKTTKLLGFFPDWIWCCTSVWKEPSSGNYCILKMITQDDISTTKHILKSVYIIQLCLGGQHLKRCVRGDFVFQWISFSFGNNKSSGTWQLLGELTHVETICTHLCAKQLKHLSTRCVAFVTRSSFPIHFGFGSGGFYETMYTREELEHVNNIDIFG